MEQMYLYVNNYQDSHYFTGNKAHSFEVKLPFQLHFNNLFECGIKEIRVLKPVAVGGHFVLTANCVQQSPLYGIEDRVLRVFELPESHRQTGSKIDTLQFEDTYYIPIVENTSSYIQFNICGIENTHHTSLEKVWLLLHIRPRK